MIIGVTGARGRLGSELVRQGCLPLDFDISDIKAVDDGLAKYRPDVVINCAAVTDVDGCEERDTGKRAVRVNGYGVLVLSDYLAGRLIHISTDYVFDGRSGPYAENAKPNPQSFYGMSKFAGEQAIIQNKNPNAIIVRTTQLFGGDKPDFVTSVLSQLRAGEPFEIPDKIYGSPTYVPHLAEALLVLAQMEVLPRYLNIAGSEVLSRYEFALMIAGVFGYSKKLIHPTDVVPGAATRPLKAGLKIGLAKRYGLPIYSPVDGLKEMKIRLEAG